MLGAEQFLQLALLESLAAVPRRAQDRWSKIGKLLPGDAIRALSLLDPPRRLVVRRLP